jgi:hypothetical protein
MGTNRSSSRFSLRVTVSAILKRGEGGSRRERERAWTDDGPFPRIMHIRLNRGLSLLTSLVDLEREGEKEPAPFFVYDKFFLKIT